MGTPVFAAIIASVCAVIAFEVIYCYLSYRRAKNDEMWQVSVEELHFSQPVEVIGQGSFGVVLAAEYRGTKVAIKRVLPLKEAKKAGGSKMTGSKSGSVDGHNSTDEASADLEAPPSTKKNPCKRKVSDEGHDSFDPLRSGSRSGSYCGSLLDGTMDDELDFLGGLSLGGPKNKWAKAFPWFYSGRESRYNASILGTASGTQGASTKTLAAQICPWFDEYARRQQEFMIEMRLLSRLRHPCKYSVFDRRL